MSLPSKPKTKYPLAGTDNRTERQRQEDADALLDLETDITQPDHQQRDIRNEPGVKREQMFVPGDLDYLPYVD